jgi:hypothetical protein
MPIEREKFLKDSRGKETVDEKKWSAARKIPSYGESQSNQ